jgi:hypothetical protein
VCCAHMLKLQFRHIDTVVRAMRVGNKYDIGVYYEGILEYFSDFDVLD